jgi:hydrogenase nickel incorporation protein HypA/HybF
MHEVSIMAEAVRMAVESAQAAGARRITGLRLRVGKLSGAVPEAMMFAWDVVRQDTMAAEATLTIEAVAAACWCATCQVEFESKDFMSECPRCNELSGDLRRGRELEIASVELDGAR